MKLSVSNIAWDNKELNEHLALLKALGCDGVEIAPSCIWPEPVDASVDEIRALVKLVAGHGLTIPAFHALLYTRPELCFFGDGASRPETLDYLKRLIRLAGSMSVKCLIYGSPASRRVGNKPYQECYDIAVAAFRELAAEAVLNETCFCIEPLGPSESDFIRTADEGYQLIEAVQSPGFGLHLDAKALLDNGENPEIVFNKYGKILQHFHVGDPRLAPPGFTGVDHAAIGRALAGSVYDGFVSIEMKKGFGETRAAVSRAVEYVQEKYFGRAVRANGGK